jgi:hypothetical protein
MKPRHEEMCISISFQYNCAFNKHLSRLSATQLTWSGVTRGFGLDRRRQGNRKVRTFIIIKCYYDGHTEDAKSEVSKNVADLTWRTTEFGQLTGGQELANGWAVRRKLKVYRRMGQYWVHLTHRPFMGPLYEPRMTTVHMCGPVGRMRICHFVHHIIKRAVTWERTRAVAVGSQRLTARPVERPEARAKWNRYTFQNWPCSTSSCLNATWVALLQLQKLGSALSL